MAAAVGKDRATIANTLRLLRLPDEIQNDLVAGALTMGHARALLALPSDLVQLQVAREVKTRGLSVRETEALVKSALEGHAIGGSPSRPQRTLAPPDVHTRAAEEKLKIAARHPRPHRPQRQGRTHRDRLHQRGGADSAVRDAHGAIGLRN